ncbi:unnamed protein product [Spodoptera littoralis]|uniref:Uncharacterized protein n=1 Tax=Spodoptera littoralis TaxID=7109 RepID=A0A9P0N699_SPOLI|nr:unnamed protein product [Spodoptera littoralis]CAH1643069.1 unnamed protein product [Spodoptera littoralis]
MEGDGEGMMAIVQGLDSAGVTLTVMNRSRQNTDRRRSPRPRIQFSENSNFPRSSVDTSTDTTRKSDTGVQICDGRYASSYKTAHCMVSPTSPPEGVSEFPPQRKEPCRNQGNFEVGGHGSGYVNQRTNSRFRVHTGCQVRADRSSGGLLHRSRSSRYTEAFVHSLRKYPSVTGRTASTDLIERLLRYTQRLYWLSPSVMGVGDLETISGHREHGPADASRGTRPSRSMRSLNEDGSSDLHDSFRASKHQQTYTRKPRDAPSGPIGYKGRARNFRLYSPVSESRHLRGIFFPSDCGINSLQRFSQQAITWGSSRRESLYRDPKFSTSYDYLKAGSTRNRSDGSPSPSGSRSPSQPARPLRFERPAHSVRDMSLSDVSKYIRSTIRQIYRERPFAYSYNVGVVSGRHWDAVSSFCEAVMLAKKEAGRPSRETLWASGIAKRSPATVSSGLRTASSGNSPLDQNQARAYNASRSARASRSHQTTTDGAQ